MARTRTAEPPTTSKSTSIVASARQSTIKQVAAGDAKGESWQEAAWDRFNDIAEFRAACTWTGNVLSKARLYVARIGPDGSKNPVLDGPAFDAMAELFGGPKGQAQMLYQYGVDYSVAGEAWLVGYEDGNSPVWKVYANGEITQVARDYQVQVDGQPLVTLPENATVIRCWRSHPRWSNRADAPSRACLPILNEIRRLTMHVEAQIDSRLAGAGILWVPNEIAVAVQTAVSAGDNPSGAPTATADRLVEAIQAAMAASIDSHDSPAALVPIVVTADGEFIDKVKHMTFWTPLDEHAIELRTEAIRRLALGLDLPPEVMTGTGNVNHWGSWQIEESAIKAYTEPLLERLTYDLTVGYLQPAILGEAGLAGAVNEYVIEADTANMRLRPNRSKEALELYDRAELKGSVLLRETGFDPSDAMDDSERQAWFRRKVASGSTTPELVAAALLSLGIDLGDGIPETIRITDNVSAKPGQEARPTPSLQDHPELSPPEDGLAAAAEQMVFRALERAGNRLRNKTGTRPPGVEAAEVYLFVPCAGSTVDFALADAWSHVPRFAPRFDIDPNSLTQALDAYCRVLISESKPHDPALLDSYLRLARR